MATLRGILASLRRLFSEPDRHRRGLRELWLAVRHLIRVLLRKERRRPRRRNDACCIELPPDVYKRPDPLIYDQYFLMKMGLAVTWDNPDIQLFERDLAEPDFLGAPVPSSTLQGNHPYRVRVTVWNGSYHAPAFALPVHLSYLSFGASTTSHPIATTHVDLHVKGSPLHPSHAFFDWTTPTAGHYCLQALLEWADDANPDNNLGQENVDVAAHHSPAAFAFRLVNDASVRRRFVLEADAYRLPAVPACEDPAALEWDVRTQTGERPSRLVESRGRWDHARRTQGYGSFALPQDWKLELHPHEIVLAPDEERVVGVSIDTGEAEGAVNVHAFALSDEGSRHLVGGATFYVTNG